MKLQDYIEKCLPTLYLQHRARMDQPVDEVMLVRRVQEGIEEDTGERLAEAEVERLIARYLPAEWRRLTPREADARWYEVLGIKPKPKPRV